MSNEILNSLLKDYEQKKLQAELDSEKRKEELYEKIPRLQEIEEELNHFAISTAKNILFHPSASLEDLTQKVEKLKQENTMLHEENKKLNETVEWMHEMIWDFVHAQRAAQAAPPLHPL